MDNFAFYILVERTKMKRRKFIVDGSLLSVGALSLLHCKAKEKSGVGKIGIQLYSVRDAMGKNPTETLKILSEIGYQDVELAGYSEGKFYGMAPNEFKKLLNDLGLETQSGHCPTGAQNPDAKNTMTNNWEACVNDAATVGNKSLVLAWTAPEERKNLDDYKYICDLLNKCGEVSKKYGIQMAYHNHDFEFDKFDDVVAYDFMIQNTDPDLVKYELDHYWVRKAGASSLDLFAKYPGRFPYWHVKDMDNTADKFFTEVGSGVIDWTPIFNAKEQSGMEYFFVEQDDYRGIKPIPSVTKSHDFLRNLDLGA